jgi:hypothetical protein
MTQAEAKTPAELTSKEQEVAALTFRCLHLTLAGRSSDCAGKNTG